MNTVVVVTSDEGYVTAYANDKLAIETLEKRHGRGCTIFGCRGYTLLVFDTGHENEDVSYTLRYTDLITE